MALPPDMPGSLDYSRETGGEELSPVTCNLDSDSGGGCASERFQQTCLRRPWWWVGGRPKGLAGTFVIGSSTCSTQTPLPSTDLPSSPRFLFWGPPAPVQ